MTNRPLPAEKNASFPHQGVYLLLLYLETETSLSIGKKRIVNFPAGYYGYVGRAKRNLLARLKRYTLPHRKSHWHIDYFLEKAIIQNIWVMKNDKLTDLKEEECRLAAEMRRLSPTRLPQLKGLGASDCRCEGHFIFLSSDLHKTEFILSHLKLGRRSTNGI